MRERVRVGICMHVCEYAHVCTLNTHKLKQGQPQLTLQLSAPKISITSPFKERKPKTSTSECVFFVCFCVFVCLCVFSCL